MRLCACWQWQSHSPSQKEVYGSRLRTSSGHQVEINLAAQKNDEIISRCRHRWYHAYCDLESLRQTCMPAKCLSRLLFLNFSEPFRKVGPIQGHALSWVTQL